MNDQQRAAMQMALEALEKAHTVIEHRQDVRKREEAITALREALAEPQITTPDVCGEVCARAKLCYGCNKDLEESNAKYAEQAEQEPVGYFAYDEEHDIWEELTGPNAPGATKLYAAPVRTKDLTDDEAQKLWNDTSSIVPMWAHHLHFARAVIAADREKNK